MSTPFSATEAPQPRRRYHIFLRHTRRFLPWLVGLLFFLLYALTAAPSITELYDDSLEFQLVGPTFGLAHPTGYPLYILLSGLWSRVLFPFGNWAWRMNLFSALAAATTSGLLFALAQRLISQTVPAKTPILWPALATVPAFALGPVWWSQATIAEVYALHNLFVAAILIVTFNLSQSSNLPISQSSSHRITLLTLLLGLALTHHRTIVLLAPGLLLMLWGQKALWPPSRKWLGWGLAGLAPLLLYLFIPLRAAMGVSDLRGSYVNSWDGFWEHVLARGYTGFFSQNSLSVAMGVGDWWRLWQAQMGLVGLGLGLLGLGWVLTVGQARRWWCGLLVILLTNLLFAVSYQVGDQPVFLLPAWLCFALCCGAGVAALTQLLHRWSVAAQGIAAGCCILLLLGIGGRGPLVNRSQDWAVHDEAVAVAKVDFPPTSRVIALEGQATALKYMQAAEGLGRAATAVVADQPADRQAAVDAAMAQGYPTYLTQEVAGIAERYSFSGEGPLVRVWPRGEAQAGVPQHPLGQPFVDGALQLVGYDLVWLAQAGGPALRLTLYWRPNSVLTEVYKVSLRFIENNQVLSQEDRYPLRLVAPTTSWLPGETVRDVYYLAAPPAGASQSTQLRIILYAEQDGRAVGAVDLPTFP
ncbi:MAG: DUF2723 domain-containing protein [Caldilinea sp. CFX5]|nr:DUF2723 domain-containing protein [Caldilinea sp. CFX5]